MDYFLSTFEKYLPAAFPSPCFSNRNSIINYIFLLYIWVASKIYIFPLDFISLPMIYLCVNLLISLFFCAYFWACFLWLPLVLHSLCFDERQCSRVYTPWRLICVCPVERIQSPGHSEVFPFLLVSSKQCHIFLIHRRTADPLCCWTIELGRRQENSPK